MYSDGDDEEYDVSIRRRTALIQPGIDSGNNYDSAAAEETNRESKNPGIIILYITSFTTTGDSKIVEANEKFFGFT